MIDLGWRNAQQFVQDVVHRARLRSNIIALVLLTSVWVVVALWVGMQTAVPTEFLLGDPVATFGRLYNGRFTSDVENLECCVFYFGAVSNLGIVLWSVAATVALLGFVVRRTFVQDSGYFLLCAGLFSIWLGADDLLLLHERLFPQLGISQMATYAIYGLVAALYVVTSRKALGSPRILFLFLALGFLALSASVDILLRGAGQFWEDTFKLAGIVYWAGFHVLFVADMLLVRPVGNDAFGR